MVESVLNWGLDIIRAVQGIASPGLTAFVRLYTQLGSEYFYLVFLPILIWCVDERAGIRFGLVFLFSAFANNAIKGAVRLGRPYTVDPAVQLAHESSTSFPSGHAQNSAMFWGLGASMFKKAWVTVLAVLMILTIAFTRIYLGVHYPSDIFGGWLVALVLLLLWLFLGRKAEALLSRLDRRMKIILLALLVLGMNAVSMHDTSMPGVFFGAALGYLFMVDYIKMDARKGSFGKKLSRFGLGLVILALLYLAGKLLSPEEGHNLYPLIKFARYMILGLWVSLGAPWLFIKLSLAEKHIDV